jgi:hypothetical protein
MMARPVFYHLSHYTLVLGRMMIDCQDLCNRRVFVQWIQFKFGKMKKSSGAG